MKPQPRKPPLLAAEALNGYGTKCRVPAQGLPAAAAAEASPVQLKATEISFTPLRLKHLNTLDFSIRASSKAAPVVLNRSGAGRSSDKRTETGRNELELMATKDLVYLALIALAGVILYLRGYHAGFARGKKMFERFFNNTDALAALPPPEPPPVPRADLVVLRGTRAFFKPSNIRAVFGNN